MNISIRKATKDDIAELAEIHVDGWHGGYKGIVDQDYINSKTIDERIKSWTEIFEQNDSETLIAVRGEKGVGFISYGALRTPPAGMSKIRPLYSSEIYAIYIKQEFYRHGMGRQLFKKAVENLMAQKHHSMCLWVLDKNKRARSFYDALGGQRIGKKMIEIGPSKVKELCYGWRDIKEILDK